MNALLWAVYEGNTNVLLILLRNKCDVRARSGAGATGLHLADVYDVVPALSREQTTVPTGGATLPERVSILAMTPSGLRALSDATTAADPRYRLAPGNRLVSVIVRAARTLGEDSAFEPSSEQTWADVRGRLGELLRALFQAGALQGGTVAEAFQCQLATIRQSKMNLKLMNQCDRTTFGVPHLIEFLDRTRRVSCPHHRAIAVWPTTEKQRHSSTLLVRPARLVAIKVTTRSSVIISAHCGEAWRHISLTHLLKRPHSRPHRHDPDRHAQRHDGAEAERHKQHLPCAQRKTTELREQIDR